MSGLDAPNRDRVVDFKPKRPEPTLEARYNSMRYDIRASLDLAWERACLRGEQVAFLAFMEATAGELASWIQRRE